MVQDTFISLGRGIDGVVSRMVDRFGDAGSGDRPSGETVELLRYAIISARAQQERVLHVDEILITDGVAGETLNERLLAPYATHADRDYLRVHTRLLRRWPRRPVPAQTRTQTLPVQAPAQVQESTARAESPRRKADRPKTPAPRRRPDLRPAATPAPAAKVPQGTKDGPDSRLIAVLAEAGDAGLSMSQLIKRTGESSAALRVRLKRLGADGTVRRAGDGLKTRYRLIDR